MSLDYLAIVSNGAYPTPATTHRAPLAVSYGLLNFDFSTEVVTTVVPSKKSWLLFFKKRKK